MTLYTYDEKVTGVMQPKHLLQKWYSIHASLETVYKKTASAVSYDLGSGAHHFFSG